MEKNRFCNVTIMKLLDDKGATNPCHRCNSTDFAVIDEITHLPLQQFISEPEFTNSTLPVALVVCKNCGAVTPHALGAFDLIPEENRYSEGSIDE